jgi:hypothetical protein
MAREIGVSYAAYRTWEGGSDPHAGPTRTQTEQLDKALRRLLRDRYVDGEAFDVWGWPRQQDMSWERVDELLRATGFQVPRLKTNGRPPAEVLWVHRVREPNLVHGVFSFAAAAVTRAGLPVHLVLDDVAEPDRRGDQSDELESRIRTWVAFASGDDTKLTTSLFSEVLTDTYVADRGWSAINDYLNPKSRVLDFLLASKAVSPQQYSTNAQESVLELLRNADRLNSDRLLTPLRNWLVFEAEIARMLDRSTANESESVITLGGEDERTLWELWHRGCSADLATRVRHIYLRPMPIPDYRAPWQEPALTARSNRTWLTAYLTNHTVSEGNTELIEWLLRSAVRLPATLNPGFSDRLDSSLSDIAALLRAPSGELAKVAGVTAKAVVEWLNP